MKHETKPKKFFRGIDLNKVRERWIDSAKMLFKRDKYLDSVALILAGNGDLFACKLVFESKEEKANCIRAVRKMCAEHNAVAVCLINEVWAMTVPRVKCEEGIQEYQRRGGDLNKEEFKGDRKERVLICFETKLTAESISFDIDRKNNELVNEEAGKYTGMFTDILCQPINEN